MAGFRPGLGRGGITHSFVVTEPGVIGPGEAAVGDGWMDTEGCREAIAGASVGGVAVAVAAVVLAAAAMV